MYWQKIKLKTCDNIYEPREDSYLLAQEVERYAFGKVLDLGTGTGIQGIVAAKKGCNVTFSDINAKALECAKANAELNNVNGRFVESDMFSRIKGTFNTIIFNPPYLPNEGEDTDMALDGGPNGRRYIDEFILEYKKHIGKDYVVLMLESSLDKYSQDLKEGFEIAASESFFFEELVVLKAENRQH